MFLLSAKVQVSFAVKEVNIYNSEVTKIIENRRRDKRLTIRLTDSEKKKIIAKSRKAKMSATDFIIACADNAVIKTPEDLRPVISQLKRIGNNINQLAAKANTLGFVDAPQLKKEAERWHKFQADVERIFLRPDKSDMKWQ